MPVPVMGSTSEGGKKKLTFTQDRSWTVGTFGGQATAGGKESFSGFRHMAQKGPDKDVGQTTALESKLKLVALRPFDTYSTQTVC
jgi:hypothetical protein